MEANIPLSTHQQEPLSNRKNPGNNHEGEGRI